MTKKFVRRTWSRYSKLGKRRKKKQVWRRPTGRDNKMRERRKNRPVRVEIGYRAADKSKKEIIMINTMGDLEKAKNSDAVRIVLGKMGNKKKMEIAKKAKEKKIVFDNLNVAKFLKLAEKKEKAKKKKAEAEKAKEKKTKKEIKEEAKAESKETKEEVKEEKKIEEEKK